MVAWPVEFIQSPCLGESGELQSGSAPHPLKLIVRRLDTLHPQIDFRLGPVMRRVGKVRKQPFETSQISGSRADHGIHSLGCHCCHGLIAELERLLQERYGGLF
jgi:hypothetical protein